MMSKNVIETLKEASKGLQFPSETDVPFEPFLWEGEEGKSDKTRVLELAGKPPKTPAKVMSLDSFFKDVTTEEDWHNAEEKEEVRRFRDFVQTLKKTLKPGRGGSYLPPLPQIRTCPIKAYGSSADGLAMRQSRLCRGLPHTSAAIP